MLQTIPLILGCDSKTSCDMYGCWLEVGGAVGAAVATHVAQDSPLSVQKSAIYKLSDD